MSKYIFKLLMVLVLVLISASAKSQYVCVMDDEFDGTTLNPDIWRIGMPWGPDYGHANDYWTWSPENISVSGGLLHLKAQNGPLVVTDPNPPHASSTVQHTSSAIFTKLQFHAGFFELKFKTPPVIAGFCASFWLYGSNSASELDCFEMGNEVGDDPGDLCGIFTSDQTQQKKSIHIESHNVSHSGHWVSGVNKDWGSGFHTVAMHVYPNNSDNKQLVVWMVDDVVVDQMLVNALGNNEQMVIQLGGGNDLSGFDCTGPSSSDFPADFQIESAKIWQLVDCNADVSVPCFPYDQKSHTYTGHDITLGSTPNWPTCSAIVRSGTTTDPSNHDIDNLQAFATNQIILKPGFEVENGAYFTANIVPCPPTAPPPAGNIGSDGLSMPYESNAISQQKATVKPVFDRTTVSIYPNPSTGIFTERFNNLPTGVEYYQEITNSIGQIVQSGNQFNNGFQSIDIGSNPPGFYVIKTIVGNKVITTRVEKR